MTGIGEDAIVRVVERMRLLWSTARENVTSIPEHAQERGFGKQTP